MYKKILAALLVLICLATPCYAEKAQRFVCDGGIILQGEIEGIREGQQVTVVVADAAIDWLNSNTWAMGKSDGIAYYGDCVAEEEGKYKFMFSIPENGVYTAYIGTDILEQPQRIRFEFIREDENALAIQELISQEADPAEVLRTRRYALGLFNSVYDVADISDAGEILKESMSGMEKTDTDTVIALCEKALLASALNAHKIVDINTYTDIFEIDAIMEYYKPQFSKELTGYMSEMHIRNVDAFDKALTDCILLCVMNQGDGAGIVKSALTQYSSYLGINPDKITADLCTSILKRGGFDTIGELTEYVGDYKEVDSPVNNSGGGTGGGKTNYTSAIIPALEQPGTSEVTEIHVFEDIKDVPWAEEAITQLYYRSIVSGRNEREFCPQDPVKREEFAKMITLALKLELVDSAFPFTDVEQDHWSYPFIRTAYHAGITSGISDTFFGRGMDISRQDLCVMIWQGIQACDIEIEQNTPAVIFADEEQFADYAREAISQLQQAGIVAGDELGRFNPQESATRAETARIIYSMLEYTE